MQQTPAKPGFSFAPVNRLAPPCAHLLRRMMGHAFYLPAKRLADAAPAGEDGGCPVFRADGNLRLGQQRSSRFQGKHHDLRRKTCQMEA